MSEPRDLLIVGAGPAGLATAIAAHQAGLAYEVVEKGVLVNSIFHFPRHMIFFTTAELLEIGGLPFVTPYEKPTQVEALQLLPPRRRDLRPAASPSARRCTGRREAGGRRFVGEEPRRGRRGRTRDGAGTWSSPPATTTIPNLLGVPGEDLPHVSHYYDEPHAFYRQARGGGGRQELGRHRRPRAVPRGRPA